MTPTEQLVVQFAAQHQLDPLLLRAQVLQESNNNPWAHNPEPKYHYLWDVRNSKPFRELTAAENASEVPPADFYAYPGVPRDAEWQDQQASWGLMQVMGAVARELGFKGLYLTELNDPRVCLDHGCRVMKSLLKWANGDIEQALAGYNGGRGGNKTRPFRNQEYVDLVMGKKALILSGA